MKDRSVSLSLVACRSFSTPYASQTGAEGATRRSEGRGEQGGGTDPGTVSLCSPVPTKEGKGEGRSLILLFPFCFSFTSENKGPARCALQNIS